MRLTAFILAILVLLLSCLPCADNDAMLLTNIKTETGKTAGHSHQPEDKDLCSPFCHCSCCTTYVVIKVPLSIPVALEEHTARVYTLYFDDAVHEISLPVWQPPRLV